MKAPKELQWIIDRDKEEHSNSFCFHLGVFVGMDAHYDQVCYTAEGGYTPVTDNCPDEMSVAALCGAAAALLSIAAHHCRTMDQEQGRKINIEKINTNLIGYVMALASSAMLPSRMVINRRKARKKGTKDKSF